MDASALAAPLAIAAALLAAWLDMRFANLRPGSLVVRVVHVIAAYAIVQLAAAAMGRLATSDAASGRRLELLLLLFVPALVYAFLAGIWLVRSLSGVVRLSRR